MLFRSDDRKEYYYFQTKDLDNFLHYFYLQEDKKLMVEESSYSFIDKDSGEAPKPKVLKEDTRTADVVFYDIFPTQTEQVWLELKATIIRGEVSEIKISKIEKESLEDIAIQNKKAQEWRDQRETLWQMKVFRFLQTIEWKLNRIFYRFFKRFYDQFMSYLRSEIDKKMGRFT